MTGESNVSCNEIQTENIFISMLPTVAIIGRPNVGKSTLFNRLVGKRLALVDDTPGVTRDRREGRGRLGPLQFKVIDTAGLEEAAGDTLPARMRQQTEAAITEADVVLFLIDARAGVTPLDRHFADVVRKTGKPVICLANKCEGQAGETGRMEAYGLGLGDPLPISAEHDEGLGELYDAMIAIVGEPAADEKEAVEEGEKPLLMAIVGRPNVGKSTLVNRLLGEERQITGPEAGITRDTVAIDWAWQGKAVRLHDTAGMRRKAKVQEKLEKLSVADTLRAVQFAEVVVLVIDAELGFERQDLSIADLVAQEGRALVIAVNKIDAAPEPQLVLKAVSDALERSLPQLRGIAVVPLSAKSGRGLDRLMPAVFKAFAIWNTRIATNAVNRWLADATSRNPPPSDKGKRVKIRFASQIKSRPPTFLFSVNRPESVPQSYVRYLMNDVRDAFKLDGVPIRILMRKGENPFTEK